MVRSLSSPLPAPHPTWFSVHKGTLCVQSTCDTVETAEILTLLLKFLVILVIPLLRMETFYRNGNISRNFVDV